MNLRRWLRDVGRFLRLLWRTWVTFPAEEAGRRDARRRWQQPSRMEPEFSPDVFENAQIGYSAMPSPLTINPYLNYLQFSNTPMGLQQAFQQVDQQLRMRQQLEMQQRQMIRAELGLPIGLIAEDAPPE